MASTDRNALRALYYFTEGFHWWNWNTEANLSNWHGVKVNAQGRVTELNLSSINLEGIFRPT